MTVNTHHLLEGVFLGGRNVVLVSLSEDEQRLVPLDGHLSRVAQEALEVIHHGVHHAVRQRVLFV